MGKNNSKLRAGYSAEDNEMIISFLLRNTNYKETQLREWQTAFLKECPNGKLGKEPFSKIYQSLSGDDFDEFHSREFCDHLFHNFDFNNNGWIDFREFVMTIAISTSKNSLEKLKWIFSLFDENEDGLIEFNEMMDVIQILKQFQYQRHNEHVTESVDELDAGDARHKSRDVFHCLDQNKDAKIDFEEFLKTIKLVPELQKIFN